MTRAQHMDVHLSQRSSCTSECTLKRLQPLEFAQENKLDEAVPMGNVGSNMNIQMQQFSHKFYALSAKEG